LALLAAALVADLTWQARRKRAEMAAAPTQVTVLCFLQEALLVLRAQMALATQLLYLATIYQQQAAQAAAQGLPAMAALVVLVVTMAQVVAAAVLAIALVALLVVLAALAAQALSL
jgi:hypothetical protein